LCEVSFAALFDYSKEGDIARARARFFHGQRDVLVVTERFHFFHRLRLRGIRQLMFYALPTYAATYVDFVNMTADSVGGGSVVATYSEFERLALERIVGTKRSGAMLSSDKAVHLFC
jgi:U3 small nucleolar RNA-associated protein 25